MRKNRKSGPRIYRGRETPRNHVAQFSNFTKEGMED